MVAIASGNGAGTLIERLALQTALVMRMSALNLSVERSRANLKGWLDDNSAVIDRAFGAYFHDPALTALYADELKEVVDDLKAQVDGMANDAAKLIGTTQ